MRVQQIYIEDGVYEKVQNILKQYHKDLSEVVNEYLERVVKKPEILDTYQAFKELENRDGKSFKNVEELFADLDS